MRKLFSTVILCLCLPLTALAAEAPPLVDADWLAANHDTSDVVVLDLRGKLGKQTRDDYLAGHVPGAIYSDYLKDGWRTKIDGVVGQMPPVADLEALIGGLGIGNDDHVVLVSGGQSALDMGTATRVYFTFKVLGHDRVSILDGGHKAYAADSARPIETGAVERPAKSFTASFRPEMLASREEVAAASASGSTLIDLRPTAQYLGEAKHPAAQRPGTIPGAMSLPEGKLTENGGHFVSASTAADLMTKAGIDSDDDSISFCNTGHWASLGWFVKSELLGNESAKLYDGSMVEWTSDESVPVEVKAN